MMQVVESGTFEAEHNADGRMVVCARVKRVLLDNDGERYYVGVGQFDGKMMGARVRVQVFVWNKVQHRWRVLEKTETYPLELLPHIAEVSIIAQKCWCESEGLPPPPCSFPDGSVT